MTVTVTVKVTGDPDSGRYLKHLRLKPDHWHAQAYDVTAARHARIRLPDSALPRSSPEPGKMHIPPFKLKQCLHSFSLTERWDVQGRHGAIAISRYLLQTV